MPPHLKAEDVMKRIGVGRSKAIEIMRLAGAYNTNPGGVKQCLRIEESRLNGWVEAQRVKQMEPPLMASELKDRKREAGPLSELRRRKSTA